MWRENLKIFSGHCFESTQLPRSFLSQVVWVVLLPCIESPRQVITTRLIKTPKPKAKGRRKSKVGGCNSALQHAVAWVAMVSEFSRVITTGAFIISSYDLHIDDYRCISIQFDVFAVFLGFMLLMFKSNVLPTFDHHARWSDFDVSVWGPFATSRPLQLELAQAPKTRKESKESKSNVLSAEELGHILQEPFKNFNFNDFIATFAIYRECARLHKEQMDSAEATKPVVEMFLCWRGVLSFSCWGKQENPCVPNKFEAPVEGILLRHQSQTSYTSTYDIVR